MILRRAAAASVLAVSFALTLTACVGQPSTSPTSASASTPTETPAPTAPATPTPEAVAPTCENTSTAQFQQMMAENGWVSWTGRVAGSDWSPFESFPTDPSAAGIVCTWGEDSDLATDNIITLAWAPIDAAAASAAMGQLVAEGYERIDASEGTYLAMKGAPGSQVDAEGYEVTYLFTDSDVRWAPVKEQIAFVTAPDDPQ